MIELRRKGDFITEPEKNLAVRGGYDVIVVGGGMAGVGAACAAAREGCSTLLLERESALGGLATLGLVNIPLDLISGIGANMLERLTAVNGLRSRNSDPEKHKLVLDEMTLEAGCDILFVTQAVDALVEGGRIKGVVVESKSGRQAVLGSRVIDCSGDADAAFLAGCECMSGRPGDGISQACSLEFRLGGVDWDTYRDSKLKREDRAWINLIEEKRSQGWEEVAQIENHINWMTHIPGRPEHCGMDEVSICFAHSRQCRPLDNRDLTRMYLEGRRQADILWKFIKANIPGFEKCYLIDTGTLLGVRESRRVVGEFVMTTADIASGQRFDDVITTSGHGYDLHNPDDVGNIKWAEMVVDGEKRYVGCGGGYGSSFFPPGGKEALSDYWGNKGPQTKPKQRYDIPYRALIPLKVDNLLVAGRCLSADFMAQSGCRLVLACINMGEAAGTAAALSLRNNITPRKLDRIELQMKMLSNGCDIGQNERKIPGLE